MNEKDKEVKMKAYKGEVICNGKKFLAFVKCDSLDIAKKELREIASRKDRVGNLISDFFMDVKRSEKLDDVNFTKCSIMMVL